jgi:NADPH:quinone reductase-like Zn-dependent oxidoreductase
MRALVFRGRWDIGVETRPDPRPGPDEVLIRVTVTGIYGSDIHGFTGENGRPHPGQVTGHETVGRVPRDPRRPGLTRSARPDRRPMRSTCTSIPRLACRCSATRSPLTA